MIFYSVVSQGSLLHLRKASEQGSSMLGITVGSITRRIQEKGQSKGHSTAKFQKHILLVLAPRRLFLSGN